MKKGRKVRELVIRTELSADMPTDPYRITSSGVTVEFEFLRVRGSLGRALLKQVREANYTKAGLRNARFMLRETMFLLDISSEKQGVARITSREQLTAKIVADALSAINRVPSRAPFTIWYYHSRVAAYLYRLMPDTTPHVPRLPRPEICDPSTLTDDEAECIRFAIDKRFESFAAKVHRAEHILLSGGDEDSALGDFTREWVSRLNGAPLTSAGFKAFRSTDLEERMQRAKISPLHMYSLIYPTTFDVVTCQLRVAFFEGLNNQPLFDLEANCLQQDLRGNRVVQFNKVRGAGDARTHPNRADRAAETARTIEIYKLARQPLISFVDKQKRTKLWISIGPQVHENHYVTVRDFDENNNWYRELENWRRGSGLCSSSTRKLISRLRKYAGKRDFVELDFRFQAITRRLTHRGETPTVYGLAACGPNERALLMNSYFQSKHASVTTPSRS
jgi:hypothetical protein